MKILHLIASVDPKGGGPIEGVMQFRSVLTAMGHEVSIACLDSPEKDYAKSDLFKIYALGPGRGTYGYSKHFLPWLKTHAHDYDAVIVDGLWQYHGFAAWLALAGKATPYYVFSHGMLDPWFKRTYPLKHLKKWLYWPWAEYRVLRDAKNVIFTCEDERILARESFWLYKANEAVTAFGVANPPENLGLAAQFLKEYPELNGKRLILYLSRIHPKKGCDLLVEAFAKVAQSDEKLHLVMAGPDQTGWMPALKAEAEKLGIPDRITWTGMLQGNLKWGAFYAAEVFCLPSHQENFGIVVAEALACGKPVLISNKVNIWREIEADGAGLVSDDTLPGTVQNLEHWLAMGTQEFTDMQERSKACFAKRFHVQRAAESLLNILQAK